MFQQRIKRSVELIKSNFLIILLFLAATFFFIVQHAKTFSWDFSAYVLNAKYLFYNGTYFEPYRQPLPSIFLALFLWMGKFGEYIYIILVSCLFLYANIKLSDTLFQKLDKNRFYFFFFSLSPFVLYYATSAGSELLSLAFFELFLASFIANKYSGHFLSLTILSRYNFLSFFPLLFLNKSYKKVISNILLFIIILAPWLVFNYISYGNWFASIIDSYALNYFYRDYIIQPFNFYSIIKITGFFTAFFVLGLLISTKETYNSNKKFSKQNLIFLLFFAIFVLTLFQFTKTPIKEERYLFNLSLPIAYFSTLFILYLKNKINKIDKLLITVLTLFFLISIFVLTLRISNETPYKTQIYTAVAKIKELGIENCKILSNHWVPLSYFYQNAYPLKELSIDERIKGREIVLLLKGYPTLDDTFSQNSLPYYPKIYEDDDLLFIAENQLNQSNCAKKRIYDFPYRLDYCVTISKKFERIVSQEFALNICKTINKN